MQARRERSAFSSQLSACGALRVDPNSLVLVGFRLLLSEIRRKCVEPGLCPFEGHYRGGVSPFRRRISSAREYARERARRRNCLTSQVDEF